MVFSSLTFLPLFLPLVCVLYALCPNLKAKNILLLVFSLVFYGWGEPVWVFIMMLSVMANYICGLLMSRTHRQSARKAYMITGVSLSLGCLFLLKYFGFFADTVSGIFGSQNPFATPVLPEANSLFQIPSCAFEGTDNVYSYNACEVTAYNEGNGEVIYSVFLLDPTVMTPEGLALGDEESKIVAAYGSGYNLSEGQYTYIGRNSQLLILTSDGFVTSIEYRITD